MMSSLFLLIIFCLVLNSPTNASKHGEPICTSRFDFEDKLLHKLVRMEHAMELLEERVTRQLDAIKTEKTSMKEELSTLQLALQTEQSEAIEAMKATKVNLETYKAELSDEIKQMAHDNESKLGRMSTDLTDALNKTVPNKYVFAVQTATGNTVNGVPTFKTVHVQGYAYDVNTGKFTSKEKGSYLFTFTIRTLKSAQSYCYIRKNESNINYASAYGVSDGTSATVIIYLTSGDVVDLKCSNWNSASVHFPHASFMGFKI